MRTCICISRKYGSNGLLIAEKVASRLSLSCYDSELIAKAVEISGVDTSLLEATRPKKANDWLYENMYSEGSAEYSGKSPQEIFMESTEQAIIEYSAMSDCVFVGRNAGQILKTNTKFNVICVFITAFLDDRIANVVEREHVSEFEAKRQIRKIDKLRSEYFEFYKPEIKESKDGVWGDPLMYDACFNCSQLKADEIACSIEGLYNKISNQK